MRYFIFILLMVAVQIVSAQTLPKGYSKLVWSDEFDHDGLPNNRDWNFEDGFVRNQEPQYYTTARPENCRIENGMLVIEAKKEQYPNAAYKPQATEWNKKEQFAGYTSASINTQGKHEWKYGRMEIRAKVPAGLGTWPAFWMLGSGHGHVKWPNCGEIDIVEFLGRDSTRVHGTVHYADANNVYRHQTAEPVVGKPADGFHIYAVEWDDKQIAFYYDNLKYFVFNYANTEYSPGNMFKQKYYLLLNLAVGRTGSWPGPIDDKILPSKYYIDYVRVYQ
jgi:beta-glucanase (GH16 family)